MPTIRLQASHPSAIARREPGLLEPQGIIMGALRCDPHLFGHRILARCHFTPESRHELLTGRQVTFNGNVYFGKTPGMLYTGATDADYVDVPLHDNLTSTFTCLAKIKTEGRPASTNNSMLISFGDNAGNNKSAIYESSGSFYAFNGSYNQFATASTFVAANFPVGSTNTIAIANTGVYTTTKGYLNSAPITNTSVGPNDAVETAATIMRIGGYWGSGWAADISIEWVVVVDGILTAAQIAEFHANPKLGLRSANDTPYLFPVAGGGGVSQELTGNSSASAVGTLGVSAEANVSVTPTGVAGSSAVGTLGVTAEINASAELSGVAVTSAVGTLTAEVGGGTTVALSGVAGTATVGALTAAGQINEFVDLLGNSSTGAVGNLIVVTGLQVALSGNAATGAVGTLGVTAEINASATLTGVGSSGAVGTLEVTVPIAVSVELTGVGATGTIGTLTAVGAGQVWTEIPPVSTIWTEIS